MFHASNVPKFIWAKAMNIIAHILNIIPKKYLHQTTPHEFCTKKKYDISYLNIFSNLTFLLIPKVK